MPRSNPHPDCDRPADCDARGPRLCRRCNFRAVAIRQQSDPSHVARMKALHADPEFKAKVSAASSARMKALHADPEFKAATSARMKALNAEKVKSLGLRADEECEWRAIRAKGFGGEEAARIVIRSRKTAAA